MIRVLLADDHALFRDAICMTLELAPDMEVVAQAGDGAEAVRCAAATPVDVVCMDMCMPGLGGIEATRRLRQLFPAVRVIGLSAQDDPGLIADMLAAGASGYVTKVNAGRELVHAIRLAHRRGSHDGPADNTANALFAGV